MTRGILILILAVAQALAQTGNFSQLLIRTDAPPPVSSFGGRYVGPVGQTPIYYWVVVRYPAGASIPFGPIKVVNTNGWQNLLGDGGMVSLSWSGMPGATGYDVVVSSTPAYPVVPCAACGIAVNTPSTTHVDGGVPTAYAGVAEVGTGTMVMNLNNLSEAVPYVRVGINNTLHRMAVSNVEIPADGCGEWVGGQLTSLGTTCAGMSPVQSVFGRTGDVVAADGDYTASQVTNVPAGTFVSVTLQGVVNEIDTVVSGLDAGKLDGWESYTIPYTDAAFIAAATSVNAALFTMPAEGVMGQIRLKHSAAFAGAGVTSFRCSVGTAADPDAYSKAHNAFVAPGDTVMTFDSGALSATVAAHAVVLNCVANVNVGNGAATILTAGSIRVSVIRSVIP